MDFSSSFKEFSKIATPSENVYVKPWGIYNNVRFKEISEPVTGNKQDGGTWKAWDFVFECDEGIYSERIFEPTSMERPEYNGKQLPSSMETAQCFIKQFMEVLYPEGCKKLIELTNSGKIKTFDQFIDVIKKIMAKAPKVEGIKFKVCGKKNSEGRWLTRLPNCNIGKDGVAWMAPYIGKKLVWSSWEEGQIAAYKSASPSDPETTKPIDTDIDASPKESGDDINFDELDDI